MNRHWQNWAGTESVAAARVAEPRSAEEVAACVEQAAGDGLRVKAVGAGHSFTGVAVTDGVRLDLGALDRLIDVTDDGLVTVGAGITLHRLNDLLWEHGLALTNLGDIDRQTLAGAVSTGTHGTGARFGGLATQIRGLELVPADGSRVRCSAGERPDLFAAARVGLGALGVITAVTLQVEPAYALHAREEPARLPDVLETLDDLVDGNDHLDFYWFPHTDRVLTKRNNRVPVADGLRPAGRVRGWVDDELLSNRVFELVNRVGRRAPKLIPSVNQVSARALTAREYVDRSYRVFASRRTVRFREMEYAVPRAAVADVLTAVDGWVRTHDERISFPVEVRFSAADDIWLSTAYDRDTAYVAVHQYHRTPYDTYFDAVEQIMTQAGGRPHWGKLHTLGADDLRPLYPRFDDFVRLRDGVDPAGLFANPYLTRVLGRPAG
ncbi:MAG: D-arabinono-1,4-lactone oxidase [Nocardioidaceae bacterium]